MTTFGTKSDAASRVTDAASGRGNSETDDGPEVEADPCRLVPTPERRPELMLEWSLHRG
jgi:hypothetical protein